MFDQPVNTQAAGGHKQMHTLYTCCIHLSRIAGTCMVIEPSQIVAVMSALSYLLAGNGKGSMHDYLLTATRGLTGGCLSDTLCLRSIFTARRAPRNARQRPSDTVTSIWEKSCWAHGDLLSASTICRHRHFAICISQTGSSQACSQGWTLCYCSLMAVQCCWKFAAEAD